MNGTTRIKALRPGWTRHINGVDCLNEANHEPHPAGYVHWHEWAERKARKFTQQLCPGCNRWAIWVPK